jgi:cullin-associated NEDD8-dissociated protein 1
MGRHRDSIVPLFSKFLGDPSDEALHTEAHNDLRETCLQGFESFVLRCPREMATHLPAITEAAVVFMKYDPNYVGDDSDDEGGAGMADDEDDEDEENDYDDEDEDDDEDDDTSWKVRRAAVKVLTAVVGSKPDGLAEFYTSHGADVVKRFSEREEHVRLEVIECFATLVRTTAKFGASSEPAQALVAISPSVLNQCLKQLGTKGDKMEKTKIAVLDLVKGLVGSSSGNSGNGGGSSGGLTPPLLEKLMGHLASCLSDKSNALKLDSLVFLRTALDSLDPASLQPSLPKLLPLVLSCVQADWYKIIAEALRVVGCMVVVLRPLDSGGDMFDASLCPSPASSIGPVVGPVYAAILPRLEASDIDQEIKECALAAMGTVLAFWGDLLTPDQVPVVIPNKYLLLLCADFKLPEKLTSSS